VPGDVDAIRGCLAWLDRLNRRVKQLAAAVQPILHIRTASPPARRVLLVRLQTQAEQAAAALEAGAHRRVVSARVAAYLDPLLADAAASCRSIGHLAADCNLEGPPPDWDAVAALLCDVELPRVRSPGVELGKLVELLTLTLAERGVLAPADPAPLWTQADSPARWAKVFGMSVRTLMRRLDDGRIRNVKHSSKSYQIDVNALPAKHRAKHLPPPGPPAS
jgi:hypothetical protein